ncbi:MAG: TonB-dependent receptor [Gammaproteobacteria bacterium]|nr:TonB-dependent receptor [Gammaproteobacteria bacterium]
MKKGIYLLLLWLIELQAAGMGEATIMVESTRLADVSGEEVKSADLAEALSRNLPGISLVRRSGIANDIILRGQKKDNINVLIDGARIYGAGPNRMDPPISYVLNNTIDGIEIIEGPYDVENSGTLSGAVRISTRNPSQAFKGEVSLNAGSWDYRKLSATVSGGNDKARVLLGMSRETSEQYEDGDGNNFSDQISHLNPTAMAGMNPRYQAQYAGMDAYKKQVVMGKLYLDMTEDQDLKLSYTANRSDNVLYPSSKMDALYDNSDMLDLDYSIRNLGVYSRSLDIQIYRSTVEHPMSTFYRMASGINSVDELANSLESDMRGLKISNKFVLDKDTRIVVGLDTSLRNWDGTYIGKGTKAGITGRKSIDDVNTGNRAVFAEIEKRYFSLSTKLGVRYDNTSIVPQTGVHSSRDYDGLSAFVFTSYQPDSSTRYFSGIGRASRVPDARELYFRSMMNVTVGTPTLNKTTNTELDFGIEKNYQDLTLKVRLFHSWLNDFIYYNAGNASNNFENVDATIYGLDVRGSWFINDEVYLDFGLAWQRGQKNQTLTGQTDTDLAEIPPLKVNLTLNYDYALRSSAIIELVAMDEWRYFDVDNGEQAIDSYAVLNLKLQHTLSRHLALTLGIDNVMNKTYSTTNTYKDLTLLADATGDVMLINEPGRYVYINAAYRF